jgi:LmbE family N-acetylglucosaminyl deacetylase
MTILIVVAHPDDEVLGCGATCAALADAGADVHACFLASNAELRGARPESAELRDDMLRAQRILGFREPILGSFPNIRLNTVPHVELVQFIERAIEETGADTIFTHHPGDVNDDHLHTSRACQAAARLAQRRPGMAPLRRLFFMEVLSSTDWAFRGGGPAFEPDAFFEVDATLARKCEALAAYRGVMRKFPHPRSEETIRGLAAFRGGQSGLAMAEAFQSAYSRLREADFA